ncbi:acyl carrier protein [Acetobacterium fimetarium]|uniref:Acyl carrier protein n=1 Tax=Acetobacterium fimetarium TaxID=52691 RepID=A0ABR6WWI2_9FIRM|nr:acyl carrier protein [Acetobacterium fimetarium]MBC3804836.1 acyl carrier protein [Acetobacterium fimetarium]
MTNLEKYTQIFTTVFEIEESKLKDLEYQGIKAWDSVGHMSLISEIEDCFDIMLDTDDIIELSTFEKGKEILKKYDIEI